ncbi:hypothetical protein DL151_26825, partial [Salmonella enterica subsp. salamae]|nr:hypothetical protein [Salmonella enterica subsp. salamae]
TKIVPSTFSENIYFLNFTASLDNGITYSGEAIQVLIVFMLGRSLFQPFTRRLLPGNTSNEKSASGALFRQSLTTYLLSLAVICTRFAA